jgi:hypothetical protein
MRAFIGRWVVLIAALAVALGAECANWRQVFLPEHVIAFVDADCYARLTRVREIIEHSRASVREHRFENYPFGIRSHTTLPLDFLILGLRAVFQIGGSSQALDLAGAWVSPLLGLMTVAGLWAWGEWERLPGRWALLLVVAASPIVAHGFALGRPDHQSLIMACMAGALAAEWSAWRRKSWWAGAVGGLCWGLGLWTSLYEPGILLALLPLAGGIWNRRAFWVRERLAWVGALVLMLGIAWLCEGGAWPNIQIPGLQGAGDFSPDYFAAWSKEIGELGSMWPWMPALWNWTGWGMLAAPVLLLLAREEKAAARAQLLLLMAVLALTCWQIRWGYFLPLVYAISLPWQSLALKPRWKPVAAAVFLLGLWPMAREWSLTLRPPPEMAVALDEQRDDALLLHECAGFIGRASQTPGPAGDAAGILAPWWLSPPLAYWSGQPAIAGSSHESLPGIADAARFYVSRADSADARMILLRRRVRWVVAYEPDRVLSTAALLLGEERVSKQALGLILYQSPEAAPSYLRLALVNPYFKVYEVAADLSLP